MLLLSLKKSEKLRFIDKTIILILYKLKTHKAVQFLRNIEQNLPIKQIRKAAFRDSRMKGIHTNGPLMTKHQ